VALGIGRALSPAPVPTSPVRTTGAANGPEEAVTGVGKRRRQRSARVLAPLRLKACFDVRRASAGRSGQDIHPRLYLHEHEGKIDTPAGIVDSATPTHRRVCRFRQPADLRRGRFVDQKRGDFHGSPRICGGVAARGRRSADSPMFGRDRTPRPVFRSRGLQDKYRSNPVLSMRFLSSPRAFSSMPRQSPSSCG
jgi:hypothetical protein